MSDTTHPQYAVGDVVNGHRLSEHGEWVALAAAFPPPPPAAQDVAPFVAPPRKRKRVFLWVFLAVQALFLVWIVAGAGGASGSPSAEDCGSLDAATCNDAESVGTAIGVFLIVGLWCVVDFLLGVGYAIYRLAKRP